MDENAFGMQNKSVPFLSLDEIRENAREALDLLQYKEGAVDLHMLCEKLQIRLNFSEQQRQDKNGSLILGSAKFDKKLIEVNLHGNSQRERFTIAHEVGHFYLHHDRYLQSETTVQQDLLYDAPRFESYNYDRLEAQANAFASELLLPYNHFLLSVEALRAYIGIYDRGFGYIFVDDQPCNYIPYNEMMSTLSRSFDVSKHAIEVRLNKLGLITDRRKCNDFDKQLYKTW